MIPIILHHVARHGAVVKKTLQDQTKVEQAIVAHTAIPGICKETQATIRRNLQIYQQSHQQGDIFHCQWNNF